LIVKYLPLVCHHEPGIFYYTSPPTPRLHSSSFSPQDQFGILADFFKCKLVWWYSRMSLCDNYRLAESLG